MTESERELDLLCADLMQEAQKLKVQLREQTDLVEQCMLAMNKNAHKGFKAEAENAMLRSALKRLETPDIGDAYGNSVGDQITQDAPRMCE